MRTGLAIGLGMAMALGAPAALAQDNQTSTGAGAAGAGTAGATVGGTVDASATTTATPPKVTTTTTRTETAPAVRTDDGVTDHERVVGHFGVGYMGLTQLPIGTGGGGGRVGRGTLDAPVVGVRYWLNEKLGIDAGLGFTFSTSSVDNQANNQTVTVDGPAAFGVALHGGVPLVFAHAKHYKFLVIPELNVGLTHQGVKQNGNPAPPDVVLSGFRLDIGGRIGTEIQFGFIGIPELSLQATVGLNIRRESWRMSQDGVNGAPPASSTDGETRIGTTVQSDPWALFVNNISAIYYFP